MVRNHMKTLILWAAIRGPFRVNRSEVAYSCVSIYSSHYMQGVNMSNAPQNKLGSKLASKCNGFTRCMPILDPLVCTRAISAMCMNTSPSCCRIFSHMCMHLHTRRSSCLSAWLPVESRDRWAPATARRSSAKGPAARAGSSPGACGCEWLQEALAGISTGLLGWRPLYA